MKLLTFGAASAALALCAFAGAQTTSATEATPLVGASVRLGFFVPVDSDADGDTFFSFGADYRLNERPSSLLGLEGYASLSVDYYRKNDFGNTPILLNYNVQRGAFTYAAGVGVGFGTEPGRSQANFSYQAGVSYDVPTASTYPIFVQAKFMGSDRYHLNGVGVYVGVRF